MADGVRVSLSRRGLLAALVASPIGVLLGRASSGSAAPLPVEALVSEPTAEPLVWKTYSIKWPVSRLDLRAFVDGQEANIVPVGSDAFTIEHPRPKEIKNVRVVLRRDGTPVLGD